MGEAPIAFLNRDRVRLDRFMTLMQIAQGAARFDEGPKIRRAS